MASTTRGPGVGDTRASKKNIPTGNDSNNSQATRGAQPRKRGVGESCAGSRRLYTVYDGRAWLGTFIWNDATRQALAWNASRRFVGRFESYLAAARAIGAAAATENRAAEARRRLANPRPPFATGLPEHFLRRGQ